MEIFIPLLFGAILEMLGVPVFQVIGLKLGKIIRLPFVNSNSNSEEPEQRYLNAIVGYSVIISLLLLLALL